MKTLQAHHGVGCTFLIQLVIVSMELFEQPYQSLFPSIHVGLMLLGVDVSHVGGHLDLKQLVSADHHLSHFKGAGVPIQSRIPLYFDGLIVTPPHGVVIVSDLFQLCVPPDALLTGTTQGPHLFVESLVG